MNATGHILERFGCILQIYFYPIRKFGMKGSNLANNPTRSLVFRVCQSLCHWKVETLEQNFKVFELDFGIVRTLASVWVKFGMQMNKINKDMSWVKAMPPPSLRNQQ